MANELSRLNAAVDSRDPAVGLAAVATLRDLVEELEELHVDNARALGWPWQTIADSLGVTRQSVHKKHHVRRRRRGGR
ncbi:MAG: helix-turn-helix domain-containing protein [Acidimicrobiia bacterium]